MSTTNRIVLLDRAGEELFSGDSLLSEPPPPPTVPREREELSAPSLHTAPGHEPALADTDDDEPIPETLRSSVLVRVHEPVSRPIIVEDAEDYRAA